MRPAHRLPASPGRQDHSAQPREGLWQGPGRPWSCASPHWAQSQSPRVTAGLNPAVLPHLPWLPTTVRLQCCPLPQGVPPCLWLCLSFLPTVIPLHGHLQLLESQCGQTLASLQLLCAIPALKVLPPSAVLRQLHRQAGSPSYLQHQLDLTPSSPTFLTSSPWWGSAAVDEGTGTPFPPPGKARPFAAECSGFPTNVFARPQ